MNRIQVLREYNEFLKNKYDCDSYVFDEDLLEFLEQTCVEVSDDEPIAKLGLSIRANNILLRGGVRTVGELEKLTENELMRFRNMGPKSLREITEKLQQLRR